MRTLCEVRWVKEGTEDDEVPEYEVGRYWLLHFGLKYELINNGEGSVTAVNYTMAICAHHDTGQIEMFDPTQLKIIGYDIKK
jgi:hypothetical protein